MDKLQNLDQIGGFPLKTDDLRLLFGTSEYDAGVYQALNSILSGFGSNFIVSGCEYDSGTGIIAEGFVFLGGELLKVDEHTKSGNFFEKVTTTETTRTFENGTSYQVHQKNRATATASVGSLLADGVRLVNYTNTHRNVTSSNVSDIDLLTSSQLYYISNASGISNLPVVSAGFLDVSISESPTGVVKQEYTTISASPEKYYRVLYASSTWSDWIKVESSNNDFDWTNYAINTSEVQSDGSIRVKRKGDVVMIAFSLRLISVPDTNISLLDDLLPEAIRPSEIVPFTLSTANSTTDGPSSIPYLIKPTGEVVWGDFEFVSGGDYNGNSLSGSVTYLIN